MPHRICDDQLTLLRSCFLSVYISSATCPLVTGSQALPPTHPRRRTEDRPLPKSRRNLPYADVIEDELPVICRRKERVELLAGGGGLDVGL